MGKKKKNIAWLIITILICVIFIPIIAINITLSIKSATNSNELPSIFGIAPTAVMTGSMSPEIEAKDLIFVQDVEASALVEDDVICFYKDGSYTTHRIERIEIVEGERRFYTKGDANNVEDKGYVLAGQIQGKYVGKVAGLGGVIIFLQNPYGLMLTVILLVVLYIAGELLIEWVSVRKENKKLKKEIEDLKAQLEGVAQTPETTKIEKILPKVVIEEMASTSVEPVEPQQEFAVIAPPVQTENNADGENDQIIITENGINIAYRYKRSFLSRLIQGNENLQSLYSNIKNYLLKFNGVKSRISWGAETFTYKRQPIAKLCVKGKSLYAYFALSDEEIASLQIDEKVEASKYAEVPAKIKITGIIKFNRATRAVDVIMERLGLTAGEELTEAYTYPYETDERLLEKGLIKLVKSNFVPLDNAPQETMIKEQTVETTEETEAEEASDNDLNIQYKYKRSFISRLIQSGENTQSLYTQIKNYLLKFNDVKNRNSWGSETFAYKRKPIAKLCVKGKSLYAYFALSDEEIASLQIDEKVEASKYAEVPAKIKITGVIKLNRATRAVDVIMERLGLTAGEELTEAYTYPYETDERLLEKGLIKLVESNFKPPVQEQPAPEEEISNEIVSDVEDLTGGNLSDSQKYTRKQYLALPRTKKKKIKALIRQVDEHLFDEDTPSNARKRQVADMWRDAVVVTNK